MTTQTEQTESRDDLLLLDQAQATEVLTVPPWTLEAGATAVTGHASSGSAGTSGIGWPTSMPGSRSGRSPRPPRPALRPGSEGVEHCGQCGARG